ncbi:MAG: sodium pump decarboxylase subunit gamma [Lachnospiraceae bacterium]|nr:sodium pump decarboxylase subunit gamma [Lachnospiraceae bacterium]
MKKRRTLFAIIAMVLCLGLFTGCAKTEDAGEAVDETIKASITMITQQNLEALTSYPEADILAMIEQYEDDGNTTMAASLDSWLTTKEEVGNLVQLGEINVTQKDRQFVAVTEATFEKRPATLTVYYDRTGSIANIEYVPFYTLGENVGRGAVHTLIGMGTVFIVLIFISLIISCFKYINAWEKKNAAAKAPASAPVPAPAPASVSVEEVAEEDVTDDLELVAVITAAIAASQNTSADGLVVRSIKRKTGAAWKRA